MWVGLNSPLYVHISSLKAIVVASVRVIYAEVSVGSIFVVVAQSDPNLIKRKAFLTIFPSLAIFSLIVRTIKALTFFYSTFGN